MRQRGATRVRGKRYNDARTMKARPWLSVVIPSHNGERWLAAALRSLVAQRGEGIEVIVVDSSDAGTSLEIVDRFTGKLAIGAYRRPDLPSWMEKTNFGVGIAQADW